YLSVIASGGRRVEELAPGPFDRLVAALRRVASDDLQAARLVWENGPGDHHLRAEHEGVVYSIRQEGDGLALVVNGEEVDRLREWPPVWSRGVALRAELRALLDLAAAPASPVTAQVIRDHLAPRARAITTSGPNLEWPPWADRTSGADDIYIELGGQVRGARISPPHYGQYVDLYVSDCSLVDVEAVAGPTQPLVKVHYDDPDRWAAYLTVNGQALRVLVERRRGWDSMVVTVHFPS
ncbi:MAG TPA: hypothetical protein VG795_08770, partial [Acidimicrobiia bacterium]|nr:hypothetical protein [Acidimicrobiia bacterium]